MKNLVLILGLLVLLTGCNGNKIVDKTAIDYCETKKDCSSVNRDCTSCSCDLIGINIKHKKEYWEKFCADSNPNFHCDKDCMMPKISCENNKCIVK